MRSPRIPPVALLLLFFGAAQLLYAPAWQAGWVRDVSGWIESLYTQSFGDYLMRRGKVVQSLYPFTQASLWAVWKVFGLSPLAWHLLMVSLHAVCAWGWMRLTRRLLEDGGLRRPAAPALFAGAFVLLSPYATEVVVWEAGFHYLQGTLLLQGGLYCLIRWLRDGRFSWAWFAALLFFPALLALEVFYLTPLYALLVLAWYRWTGRVDGRRFRQGASRFLLPQLLLCAGQYAAYRMCYSRPVPHIGQLHAAWVLDYVRKPAKYLFHVFLNGRYWPEGGKRAAYRLLDSLPFLVLFWGAMSLLVIRLWQIRRRLSGPARAGVLFAAFAAGALLLVLPLHFHESGYVYFDRYAYFLLPPAGALLGLGLQALPLPRITAAVVLVTNAALLLGTVLLWRRSDALSRQMLRRLPAPAPGQVTVLLNVPNALQGVPMIGATHEGEAALMRRYVLRRPFPGALYEPTACNLRTEADRVSVTMPAPGTVRVTLPGREGWWSGGVPTASWAGEDFAVRMTDPECCYELILKRPLASYRLLVWEQGAWHAVGAQGVRSRN